jgi:hypothetical protein
MIIANGQVRDITVAPADPEADPPTVELATVQCEVEMPQGTGVFNLILPNAAMGGIVVGPCRVMLESA